MRKRSVIRVVSVISVAALVVAGIIGNNLYIRADVLTDGSFAYFKDLTPDEKRIIIFDAYASNSDRGEDYVQVKKTLLAIYDDLETGKLNKVPVDVVQKYQFWRNYWGEAKPRGDAAEVKYLSYNSDSDSKNSKNIAYAASPLDLRRFPVGKPAQAVPPPSEPAKRKSLFDKVVKTVTDITRIISPDKTVRALSAIAEGINSGTITTIPSEAELHNFILQNYAGAEKTRYVAAMLSDAARDAARTASSSPMVAEGLKQAAAAWDQNNPSGPNHLSRTYFILNIENEIKLTGKIPNLQTKSGFDAALQRADTWANQMAAEIEKYSKDINGAVSAVGPTVAAFRSREIAGADIGSGVIKSIEDSVGPGSDGLTWNYTESNPKSSPEMELLSPTPAQIQSSPEDRALGFITGTRSVGGEDTTVPVILPADTSDTTLLSTTEINAVAGAANAGSVIQTSLISSEATPETLALSPNMSFAKAKEFIDKVVRDEIAGSTINLDYFMEIVDPADRQKVADYIKKKGVTLNSKIGSSAKANSRKPQWSGVGTLGINSQTGNFEYTSVIKNNGVNVGYISFDPSSQSYSAQLPYTYRGMKYTLYAQPRTGDTYLEFARVSDSGQNIPLFQNGNVALMDITVSKSGGIGGQFKFQNRVFNYNAISKAFEVPISISKSGKLGFAKLADPNDRGTIYLDTKGNITGQINILSSSSGQGNLFFDRGGNLAFGYTFAGKGNNLTGSSSSTVASVFIDQKGNFSGTANVGKLANLGHDLFISVGNGGITGINVPIGSIAGNAIGIGIGKDGSISLGGFIPISGIPIPISLSQDEHGNFGLSVPFIGTIITFGHEDRPQFPPQPQMDADGNISLDYIYVYRHSLKKGLKTIVVYQPTPIQINEEEKIARSKMIFDAYNNVLKRNPSLEEFANWYIYGGHMPEGSSTLQDPANSALRLAWLSRNLTGEGNNTVSPKVPAGPAPLLKSGYCTYCSNSQWRAPIKDLKYAYGNKKEYDWIKSGKAPEDCPDRPKDIMAYNPLTKDILDNAGNSTQSTTTIKEFLDMIDGLSKNDPEIDKIINEFIANRIGNTVSPTPEATSSSTDTSVTFSQGYNTYVVPDSMNAIDPSEFTKKGLTIFSYDPISKAWKKANSTENIIGALYEGVGYYVYNPSISTSVNIKTVTDTKYLDASTTINPGWNLIANSTASDVNLGEIRRRIGNGETKSFTDYLKAKQIYSNVFQVKDGSATDPTKAFQMINLNSTNGAEKIITSHKVYWIYVF